MSEPRPAVEVKDLFVDNWDVTITEPEFHAREELDQLRHDLTTISQDTVIVSMDPSGFADRYRGNWVYKDTSITIRVEICTLQGYQRLYDIFDELRGIVKDNTHLMTNYQVIKFNRFYEENDETFNFWKGSMHLTLENAGVTND